MAVDDCASMLSEKVLAADPLLFDAAARETKGDLVPWASLREWVLPDTSPCPYDEWKDRVVKIASSGNPAFERLALLLPAIEQVPPPQRGPL